MRVDLRSGLINAARTLGRLSRAIWASWRPGRLQSDRARAGLSELRRRYVFGGITRTELEEGLRKVRRRFRRIR